MEWKLKVLARLERLTGIYIPRGNENMYKTKYVNKAFLKRMIESEGYGE